MFVCQVRCVLVLRPHGECVVWSRPICHMPVLPLSPRGQEFIVESFHFTESQGVNFKLIMVLEGQFHP